MNFLYIGNAIHINPAHIVRIRATKIDGHCEIITSDSSVYVVNFNYLDRSEVSLTLIADKLRVFEESRKGKVSDKDAIHRPPPHNPEAVRTIMNSLIRN